ncbi:PUB13, partial [Symbiodinium necroappetens]
ESAVEVAYQKFLATDIKEGLHARAWSFHLKSLALVRPSAKSAQLLLDRGAIVESALAGKKDERLRACDEPFVQRVDWLVSCCAVSKQIGPIINRWKIPVRFDPQSPLVAWAVDQRVDLESEEELARCLPEIAEQKGQEIGLTEWNQDGNIRLSIFKRWYCVPDIADASQRERELQWISTEAKKAGLSFDLLEKIQKQQDPVNARADSRCSQELRPEEMLYLMPKGPPGKGRPTRVSFQGRIVPGSRTCWISFPARYAPCWDALTGESATDSVACIFHAEENGHEKDGGGEGERGWQGKWLEKVQEAVENGQRLKVALPPGRLGATQEMEMAKAKEMGWSYEEVDVFDVLEDQFPRGVLVDAWCEATKSWRRGTVEEQDVVVTEQGDGFDAVVRWTLRCQLTGQIFDSSCVCSTFATMKAQLDCFGDAKLRGILMECLPHIDVLDIGTHRLRPDLVALRAKLHIKSIGTLHKLRNRILNDDLERDINAHLADPRWEVEVSKSHFVEMYDASLRALDKLTCHQRERLSVIRGSDMVHLSAPAGAGKTFVAVERVIDALNPGADEPAPRVLYVAATVELIYYFVQWLAVRIRSQKKDLELLSALVVLFKPYKNLLRLRMPVLQEGDIEFEAVVMTHDKNSKFDLLVIDESHNMYQDGVDRGILDDLHGSKRLLLSDNAQSSAVTATFPEMEEVQLTEVVRSTKQIVLGAASFQVNAEAAVPVGTEGPPVKSFIFNASKDEDERMKHYAQRVMDAILHVDSVYSGVSLHKRLALLVPDGQFLTKLKKALSPLLREGLPHRKLRLVKHEESLRSLPEWLRSADRRSAGEQQEHRQEEIFLEEAASKHQSHAAAKVWQAAAADAKQQKPAKQEAAAEKPQQQKPTPSQPERTRKTKKVLWEQVPQQVSNVWDTRSNEVSGSKKPAFDPLRAAKLQAKADRFRGHVEKLRSADVAAQEQAARKHRASVAAAGAIPPLVELLSSSITDVQKAAAGTRAAVIRLSGSGEQGWAANALRDLAISADNQALIAEAGGIPPLVELLSSSNTDVQMMAAAALRHLASNADNKALIAEAGGIPPLVSCLTTGTKWAQLHAAEALGTLMADWIVVDREFVPMPEATEIAEANQASIASAGAIDPLIEMLTQRSGVMGFQEMAAQALRPFSSREDTRVAIVEAGAIPVLARLLTQCEPEHQHIVQHSVVGILHDLAENAENVAAIVEAEAVPSLVFLTDRAQEAAAELLLKLCAHPQGLSEAKRWGALDAAAELETSGTPAAQEAAKRLVALLRPGNLHFVDAQRMTKDCRLSVILAVGEKRGSKQPRDRPEETRLGLRPSEDALETTGSIVTSAKSARMPADGGRAWGDLQPRRRNRGVSELLTKASAGFKLIRSDSDQVAEGREGGIVACDVKDIEGEGWFGKWQTRVVQSMDVLLQNFKTTENAVDVQLLLIMDGSSKNCEKERAKIHDLKEVLRHHYRNAAFAFEVHHLALYIADLKEELSTKAGKFSWVMLGVLCKEPSEDSFHDRLNVGREREVAYQKFLATGIKEGLHARAWSFHLKSLALEVRPSAESAQLLLDRGAIVESALAGTRDERLRACDKPFDESFVQRVDWLVSCSAVSKQVGPIINRWKIPVRFDPQSPLVAWAVDQRVDLESEDELARCLPEIAEQKGQEIGLTEWNQDGKTRLAIFKRWYRVPDIADASQRERELQWISTEANKAGLSFDLLEKIQKQQDAVCIGLSLCRQESRPEEMIYLLPKGRPARGLPTKVSFPGRIVPGATTCWISFPAKYAACWDMLTCESPQDSVACIFQADEDSGPGLGCHADCCPKPLSAQEFCRYRQI